MELTSSLASFSSSLDSIVFLFGTGGDLCRDITNEPVKHGYPIPPTGFLNPLHLNPLHLNPPHLNPLHLNPLPLRPLLLRLPHLRPTCGDLRRDITDEPVKHGYPMILPTGLLCPLHLCLRPLHLRLLHLRPLHLCPLHLCPLHLRPTCGDLRRDITDELVKHGYPIPPTSLQYPLHLCLRTLHLRPLHLRPLHLFPLHLCSLHLRPTCGDLRRDITDEPVKHGYPIPPTGLLYPLHLCLRPLHLRPLHLRPLHLCSLHLCHLHLCTLHLRPLHPRLPHLRPTCGDLCRDITEEPVKRGYPIPPMGHLRPLHLRLRPLHLRPLHLRPTGGILSRDITDEPVKWGYLIPPTGFLRPLLLRLNSPTATPI